MNQTNQPTPVHHWITWPTVAIAVIAAMSTQMATVQDYWLLLVTGVFAVAGGIAGSIVSRRAKHDTTFVFAVIAALIGLYTVYVGIGAYQDYQQIVDNLKNLTDY